MKTTDIENKLVTFMPTINGRYYNTRTDSMDYGQRPTPLRDVLITQPLRYKDCYLRLRSLPYHCDEQRAAKEKLPCFIISGTFETGNTQGNKIITHTNLMIVDIDKKDNPDIDLMGEMRDKLFNLPFVYSCLKSASGEGLFLIIPIKDDTCIKSYVQYLSVMFKKNYGIVIDTACKDISRKRTMSYDEDYKRYIKTDCEVEEWGIKYVEIPIDFNNSNKPFNITPPKPRKPQEQFGDDNLTQRAIEYLINVKHLSVDDFRVSAGNSRSFWWYMAGRLKVLPNGRELFHTFSRNTSNYNDSDKEIDKMYDSANVCTDTVDEYNRWWRGQAKKFLGKKWYLIDGIRQ